MIKFQPTYTAVIYTQNETITIKYPITCKMNVSQGIMSDATKGTFEFYNLSDSTRANVFQDVFTVEPSLYKYIHFFAGYEGNETLLFKGRILQAYSTKTGGSPDIITHIQAQALDVLGFNTSHTFAAGTSYREAHDTIAGDMPNVTIGNVGALEGTFLTPTTFDGNAFTEINKLTGGHTFVDNGVLNTLMNNECIDVPVPVITDSNGLLDTPIRRDAQLEVRMLFEPSLILGQLLEIQSKLATNYNGQYKVVGFTHDCLFSGRINGNRTTTVNLLIGALIPNSNISLTDEKVENNFNKVKNNEITTVDETVPSSVRDVYNYIQKNNGKIPNSKITSNISWKEMLGHDNTDAQRKAECTMAILGNVYNTARIFQRIFDMYFKGKILTITSGWRSRANNTKCGGKSNSKHLYGLAMDFHISGITISKAHRIIDNHWQGYTHPYLNFIHVQRNPQKGVANDK